jgi:hypothetical protein
VRIMAHHGSLQSLTSDMVPDILKKITRVFEKIVLSLGSVHLTVMAAFGLWVWSSPYMFEKSQPHLLESIDDLLPVGCTYTSVLSKKIPMTSQGLRLSSMFMYSVFLIPGLNLLIPALVFLALFILYHQPWNLPRKDNHSTKLDRPNPSTVPIVVGLLLLLGINIVFLFDIETTIHEVVNQRPDESQWSFGQTLALLLLSLPIRDLLEFLMEVRALRRREKDTGEYKLALDAGDLQKIKKLAKNADVTRFEVRGVYICCVVDGRLMCTSSSFTTRSV